MSVSMELDDPVREFFFQNMIRGVPAILDSFDRSSGRFLAANGGWTVTNQDCIYPLALLLMENRSDNPYYNSEKILSTVLSGGDAIRSFQYPDGKVEFVKVDGSKWGPIYMPWTMYHWLETYALLKGVGAEEDIKSWGEGLNLAFSGIYRELLNSGIHNIPTWNAMSLHRAGQIFKMEDWIEAGDVMIQRVVEAEDEEGFWPEHGGPTTSYNLVYVHALGLYHHHGGKINVIPALRRALDFHICFTYPDGSQVETIDGRVKYHKTVKESGFPGFCIFPDGRRFIRYLVESPLFGKPRCTPHLASAYVCWPGGEEGELLLEHEEYSLEKANALVSKEKGWFFCLSAITTPATSSRWGMDRQSFVSLWNRGTGLLIGGGNSKDQPDWSTFIVKAEGDTLFIPVAGRVDAEGPQVVLEYGNGSLKGRVAVAILSEKEVRIFANFESLKPGATVEWHLPFRLKPGDELLFEKTPRERVLTDTEFTASSPTSGSWFGTRDWRVYPSCEWRLHWPSFPFNPYHKEGKADLSDAVCILALPVSQGFLSEVRVELV